MATTTDRDDSPSLPVVSSAEQVRRSGSGPGGAVLSPEEHVLSTLERDGSRRWLYPSLSKGRLWWWRRIVAYVLIVVFVAIPHLRISGKPLILLDIPAREFTLFGHTFLPTDTLLLAFALVGLFVSIALVTAVGGRLWCGWACPQTVYMEYLFRPIDRLFEGTVGRGGRPRTRPTGAMRVARWGVYLVLSMLLAHTFLAYFVGTERLAQWIRSSPAEHPIAFLVMFGTTVAMLFDFLFFREQLCLIACPYGRFQSVMLDRRSLIVGYDARRGEPRGKLRNRKAKGRDSAELQGTPAEGFPAEGTGTGDCVDCGRCVAVCPTGIDIRDGLQMECINCTQCIDACNDVMRKVGRPEGLIRYSSQDGLDGKPTRLLRPRTVLYPLVLIGIGIAFVSVLSTKYAFDARPLRAGGNPFSRGPAGEIRNSFRLRIDNRSDAPREYSIELREPTSATLEIVDRSGLTLGVGGTAIVPLLIELPRGEMPRGGRLDAQIRIRDDVGNQRDVDYTLLGPRG